METQKALRLSALPDSSAPRWERIAANREINNPVHHVTPEKLLSDLLKRQVRRILGDITECPTDTIRAHLARLQDWRETVEHLLRHALKETPESRLSGAQLIIPETLADWLAAAEITRQQHRAPAFVNSRDSELAQINRKLDTLAGLLATRKQAMDLFTEQGEER